MKSYVGIILVFALLLVAIPALSLVRKQEILIPTQVEVTSTTAAVTAAPETTAAIPPVADGKQQSADVFKMLDTASNAISELPAREYVIGAVSAEMPAAFHIEALKAQAVAVHTYAVRQREKEKLNPTKSLNGADFSNNPNQYQAFFTPQQAQAFYGDKYEENTAKITAAVDAVLGEILTYNNEPIIAAFHSMSGGMTENSAAVWGSALDYLVAVDSKEDAANPNFMETKNFTPDELKARLTTAFADVTLPEDKNKWLCVVDRTTSGTVTSLTAGSKILTGMELRTALSLRSANFTTAFDGTNFTIVTKGYGHGVGLSQYGANALANEGKSYKEILSHYYKGVELTKSGV